MKKETKTRIWSSLAAKLVLLAVVSAVTANAFNLWTSIPTMKTVYLEQLESTLVGTTSLYGAFLDAQVENANQIGESMQPEDYATIIETFHIHGMETEYGYLTDSNGVILYHPDSSLIGKKRNMTEWTESESVQENAYGKTNFITYSVDGSPKYAGQYISNIDGNILVIEMEANEPRTRLKAANMQNVRGGIFAIGISSVLSILFIRSLLVPIRQIISIVLKTTDLDFVKQDIQDKLSRRSDEVGAMSRAIDQMRERIVGHMEGIRGLSNQIDKGSEALNRIAFQVNEDADDNSASAEESHSRQACFP